jgi:Ca-activated chloride channel family protein
VIGDAIRTASKGFDPDLSSQKVLIVMTDGEDSETDPIAAAQDVAAEDILIYTIGFGTPEGEPVPVTDQYGNVIGYKQDQQGNPVISRLDEVTLEEVSRTGNGKYYRASADGAELDTLLEEIDQLQKAQLESRFEIYHIERFQIFLTLSVLVLIFGELIPERRTNRSDQIGMNWLRRSRPKVSTLNSQTTVQSSTH